MEVHYVPAWEKVTKVDEEVPAAKDEPAIRCWSIEVLLETLKWMTMMVSESAS
jgi:hypothetical protein